MVKLLSIWVAAALPTLTACGDDDPATDTAGDADAETEVAPVDTSPVDTAPIGADRQVVQVRNILVNGRTTLVADPGQALEVTLGYTIWSAPECPECTHQLVIGLGDGSSVACAYDGAPGAHPGVRTDGSVDLVAPSAPGSYDILWELISEADCTAAVAAFPAGSETKALGFLVE